MDLINTTIQVAVIWLTLCVLSVNTLIGLRPPKHKQESTNDKRQKNGIQLKGHHALTFKEAPVQTECYFPELFRCSSLLLQQSILNQSTLCDRIHTFTQCSKAALSREGKRHYIKSLSRLNALTRPLYSSHNCPQMKIRQDQTHWRHMQSKDSHTGDCCTSTLFTCTLQTVRQTDTHPGMKKCEVLSGYKHCLHTSTSSCQWTSFLEHFPALTSFNLHCKDRRR